MGIGKKELDKRFSEQSSSPVAQSVHSEVDKIVRVFAGKLDKLIAGTGRNVSLAFTSLEDVAHRAHAAIRNGEHEVVTDVKEIVSDAVEIIKDNQGSTARKPRAPRESAKTTASGKPDGRSKEARAAKAAALAATNGDTASEGEVAEVTPIRRRAARRPSQTA